MIELVVKEMAAPDEVFLTTVEHNTQVANYQLCIIFQRHNTFAFDSEIV